jgi:hypothetical protein
VIDTSTPNQTPRDILATRTATGVLMLKDGYVSYFTDAGALVSKLEVRNVVSTALTFSQPGVASALAPGGGPGLVLATNPSKPGPDATVSLVYADPSKSAPPTPLSDDVALDSVRFSSNLGLFTRAGTSPGLYVYGLP